MKCIYIKNYLFTSRHDKLEFFQFIGVFKSFKVIKQKIMLEENSLLLEFDNNTDIKQAKESIEVFFTNYENIEVVIISDILHNSNSFSLKSNDKIEKEIKF